jgi:hypothetical protein
MSVVAVRAALETALNGMTALATVRENESYTPVSGTPYQQVHILFADPDNLEYGRRHRELGYMQVKLMYPLQAGTATIAARAELIRTTFYRGASFTSGGFTVIVEKTPEVGSGQVEGDRWAVPVRVRFFANVA